MSEKIPAIPGVNLPSAYEEEAALLRWSSETLGNGVLWPMRPGAFPVLVLMRPRPTSHALVVVLTRVDWTLRDDFYFREELDTLTLHGYRTAVCPGYLAAQKTILDYLHNAADCRELVEQAESILHTPSSPPPDP
jgi:hypothetical protein